MKLVKTISICLALALAVSCSDKKEPVDYVNPCMGNISILLQPARPTVQLPNSIVRVYPVRGDYAAECLEGLPVITVKHREETAFRVYPYALENQSINAKYTFDNEKVTPYSYNVVLDNAGIDVAYAPSHQSAIYDFTFKEGDTPSIVFVSYNGELSCEGSSLKGYEQIGNYTTKIYAYAETDVEPATSSVEKVGKKSIVTMTFPEGTAKVNFKYGVSYIDDAQAKANLDREIAGFDVAAVAAEGRKAWNKVLSNIKIEGSDEDAKTVFYTSLWRTYERMICMDEGGRYYSPYDGEVHETGRQAFYNDDWIWDTHIATHPLRVIIEPEMEAAMLNSYVTMARQMGNMWMPTFPEAVGDTRRMNCNHAVASMADAYWKGLTDFDAEGAFEASKKGMMEKTLIPWRSNPAVDIDRFYWENGWFPALRPDEPETVPEVENRWERRQNVTVTLGTAYDCWCLARLAKALGKDDEYEFFAEKGLNYRTIFNPETKFFHPRHADGSFIENVDYSTGGPAGGRQYYGENNGWLFRWEEQQNIADLVSLLGGPEEFVSELDKMFAEPIPLWKLGIYNRVPDHTGIVGQFCMGNEPACHIPYLYCYAGQPWKTQKRIRTLVSEWFRNDLIGLPGDEDGGGMSGFVVFSQLGFYPVTPGLPMYVIGSPVFEKATIDLHNGKTFTVIAKNYDPANKYIQSAKFNGETFDRCWFTHEELIKGGCLEFVMGPEPNKQWAAGSVPPSFEM